MFKIITIKNLAMYNVNTAICAKSMELFELYSKEKANIFA